LDASKTTNLRTVAVPPSTFVQPGATGRRPDGLNVLAEQEHAIREPRREPHALAVAHNPGDRIFRWVTTAFAALVILTLLLMLGVLVKQSWLSVSSFGATFLTRDTWDPVRNIYGARPAILGTLYTSFVALLLAGAVGILVAIFLTEMAPLRIRRSLGFLVELLGAVPSIVYGLWALFVLVPLVRNYIQPLLVDHFGNTPFFSGYPLGLGVFTASLILAIMILPTIASISRDVLGAVPNAQREAMLALGATRWEATWKVVIPYARSGIIGSLILALGRAIGETMAVQMVIGNTLTISASLFNLGTTMPATLVTQFSEATGDLYTSALMEIGLILLVLTVLINAAARLLVWSVTRRYRA